MRSLTLIPFLLFSTVCYSQRWVPVGQTSPKFQAYYSKFRSAVQRADKPAVAALASFPFERSYGSDEDRYLRFDFLERYDEMFAKATVFAESDPTVFEFKSGYIALFDPANSEINFLFKPIPGGYAFYSFKPEVFIKLESTGTDFQGFYTELRASVSSRNTAAVAALTQFPFKYTTSTYNVDSDTTGKDTGSLSKAEFLRKMKFNLSDFPKAPEFIVHADETFSTLCENYDTDDSCAVPHFFQKIRGTYKLTEVVTEKREQ